MAGAEFRFVTTVLASCWPSVEGADLFEPVNQTYKLSYRGWYLNVTAFFWGGGGLI
jgi:hypothetical protein